MRIRFRCRWQQLLVLLILALPSSALAMEAPAVAQNIPAGAVYAVFISRPDEAIGNLQAILDRFKALHPDLDLSQQGEKVREFFGENLLTRQGLEAFGIDLGGTMALYSSEIRGDNEVMLAIPLKDPGAFKDRLFAAIEKKMGQPLDRKPKVEGGVEIYTAVDAMMGFQGSWFVLQGGAAQSGKKNSPLQAFFAKGKKLAATPAFTQALSGMSPESQVWVFLDMKELAAKMDASMKSMAADIGKAKGLSKQQQASIRKDMEKEAKEERDVMKALAFVDSASFGLGLKSGSAELRGFFGARPAGLAVVKKLFPDVGTPAFQDGLMGQALLGGWMSLDLLGLVNQFGAVPSSNGMTVKQEMDKANLEFKKKLKIDLFKDVLANFKGPWSVFFLSPGKVAVEPGQPTEQQIFKWIKIAAAVRLGDGSKAAALIKQLSEMPPPEKKPEISSAGGATLFTFKHEGLNLTVGVKGDTLFVTLGEGVAEQFLKSLPEPAWAGGGAGDLAFTQMNFANLTEAMTSAVNAGVGGEATSEFRTIVWPMVQSVLAKFGKVSFSGKLLQAGLQLTAAMDFR